MKNLHSVVVASIVTALTIFAAGCATSAEESPPAPADTAVAAPPGEWKSVPLDPRTGGIEPKDRKGCRAIYFSSSACLAVTVCCDDGCGEQSCYGACGGVIGGC